MRYYKVKKEYNNKQLLKNHAYYDFLIPNELYTQKEIERLQKNHVNISFDFFDPVEIPKNTTYFFFGARFAGALK